MNTEKLLTFVDHTLLSQTATPQQKEAVRQKNRGLHRYRVSERIQQQ